MNRYPPIAEHGLIGDLQTAALVTTDGTIDWFCCPRFDSPSVFAALLDRTRGGHFRIAPVGRDYEAKQLYFPDSAVLITRFMTPDGVGEVVDFMPIDRPEQATAQHRLVRLVRVVRGQMRFAIECAPRFDYGRQSHEVELLEQHAAIFRTKDLTLTLRMSMRPEEERLERHENDVRAGVTLHAGQIVGFMLESAAQGRSHGPPRRLTGDEVRELFLRTVEFWRAWLDRSTYHGRWREDINRSAMTLKLMTYAPTGAIVAAVTAGLPEQIGGERNWDYRYTWIRDASFSVYALLGLGYTDEALAFLQWVRDRVSAPTDGHGASRHGASRGHGTAPAKGTARADHPLKIMYRVDGSSDLHEETLEHFEGYQGSRPVRIGNGAADQLQLDIYGELLDSIYLTDTQGLRMGHQGWMHLLDLLDWLSDHWDQPEEGIWETRGGQKDFTYGRLMSWVAFDRAIRLATRHGLPANLPRLTAERDRVYEQIMEKGWNARRGAFVQHYGTDVLDASLLMMPLVGFVAPQDPMWLATLRAMDQELVSDSLVYRYNPSASPDGLRGHEGTFSIATYWYVDALARSGRLEEARLTFEKMATYSNHLGLFAEQIGLTGEQLGNFPQAFTHLALINAALNLDYQLDHGAGLVDLAELRSSESHT